MKKKIYIPTYLQEIVDKIGHYLQKKSPGLPIFITGETGVGKSTLAMCIHNLYFPRWPLVVVDCGMVTEKELKKKILGEDREGTREKPCSSEQHRKKQVLILKNVNYLSPQCQQCLVSIFDQVDLSGVFCNQTNSFGSIKTQIISTFREKELKKTESKNFIESLRFRLNALPIPLLPMSNLSIEERREILACILSNLSADLGLKSIQLSNSCLMQFTSYPFPGNLRELVNILQRSILAEQQDVSSSTKTTILSHLWVEVKAEEYRRVDTSFSDSGTFYVNTAFVIEHLQRGKNLKSIMEERRKLIEPIIIEHVWCERRKKIDCAKILGISRPTLDSKIEKYNLKLR